ncbi:MAG: hypothetical protein PHC41_15170 [Lachnospiraceae bacterium]|nr:hypothetical protein [Lachnospiraceae bacterium]MDD3617544.1 hypothetical protein [Lachnospiraceae bacterium]
MSVDELMQIKTETSQKEEEKTPGEIVSLILRAVCLAMGVAVVVLSLMGAVNTETSILMLGIGVACAGVSLLNRK